MLNIWDAPIPTPMEDDPTTTDLGLLATAFVSPRATFRQVREQGSTYGVMTLAALTGVASLSVIGEPDGWLRTALVMGLPILAVLGVLGTYVQAMLVSWSASVVLGSSLPLQQLAAVVAWGSWPETALRLPSAALAFCWGMGLVPMAAVPVLASAAGALQLIGWVWSWFTMGHMLGEALEVSAGKALLVFSLPGLVLSTVLGGLVALIFFT